MNNTVFKSASWLTISGIAESVVGLMVSILTVRYLGPSNYGLINYAASLVSVLIPFAELGFNSIFVYEVLKDEDKDEEVSGTLLLFSLISALICYIGMIAFVFVSSNNDQSARIVCMLYGTLLILNSLKLIEYWFQAKMLHKNIAIVSFLAYLISSVYKIYLLSTEKSIFWFALSNSLDSAIVVMLLLSIYKFKYKKKLKINFEIGIRILKKSKFYIVSTMMVTLYSNMDKIMIKQMLGDEQNGYYGAALTISMMTYFVYSSIVKAYKPKIIEYKNNKDMETYKNSIINLYSIIFYLSVIQSIVFSLMSKYLIKYLFGLKYMLSSEILVILSFSVVFNYLGLGRDVWVLAEEKHKVLPMVNLLAVSINFILNFILIKSIGVIGAAYATLITYVFVNFIFGFFYKPLVDNNYLVLKALNPKLFIGNVKYIINKLKSVRKENI